MKTVKEFLKQLETAVTPLIGKRYESGRILIREVESALSGICQNENLMCDKWSISVPEEFPIIDIKIDFQQDKRTVNVYKGKLKGIEFILKKQVPKTETLTRYVDLIKYDKTLADIKRMDDQIEEVCEEMRKFSKYKLQLVSERNALASRLGIEQIDKPVVKYKSKKKATKIITNKK